MLKNFKEYLNEAAGQETLEQDAALTEYFSEIINVLAENYSEEEHLDDYFANFCDYFELDNEDRQFLYDVICEAAEQDYQNGAISFANDDEVSLADKVMAFLTLLRSAKPDPSKPFIAPKMPGRKDPYDSDYLKGVETYSRSAHRQGHDNNVGDETKSNALRTSKKPVTTENKDYHLPSNKLMEGLQKELNPRYLQALNKHKGMFGTLAESDFTANPAAEWKETQKLRDANKHPDDNKDEFSAIKSQYRVRKW